MPVLCTHITHLLITRDWYTMHVFITINYNNIINITF